MSKKEDRKYKQRLSEAEIYWLIVNPKGETNAQLARRFRIPEARVVELISEHRDTNHVKNITEVKVENTQQSGKAYDLMVRKAEATVMTEAASMVGDEARKSKKQPARNTTTIRPK